MISTAHKFLIVAVLFVFAAACSGDAQGEKAGVPKPSATPGKGFTAADVAKLKWIEGTWRGMDGDKPFFERYRIEETAMVVEAKSARRPARSPIVVFSSCLRFPVRETISALNGRTTAPGEPSWNGPPLRISRRGRRFT